MISPREVWKKISAFIFQLSGWALVAPSCFALQVPGVRGLQAQGRHVLLSCSNFTHERSYVMRTYTSLRTKPFEGSGSETIRTYTYRVY